MKYKKKKLILAFTNERCQADDLYMATVVLPEKIWRDISKDTSYLYIHGGLCSIVPKRNFELKNPCDIRMYIVTYKRLTHKQNMNFTYLF